MIEQPVTIRYRGYHITYDKRAADIWQGAEYITTEYAGGVEAAMRVIDQWVDTAK
jgi:hypothetical protein